MLSADVEKDTLHGSSSRTSVDRNGSPKSEQEKPLVVVPDALDKEFNEVWKLDSTVVRVQADIDEALERLPPHEREIIKRQLDVPPVKVTYFTLFRFASKFDLLLFFISAIAAIGGGIVLPLMTIVFGQLTGTFQGFFQGTLSQAAFTSELEKFTLYFVYLGVANFVVLYIATAGSIYVGDRVSQKTREAYLAAILR